MADLTRSDGRTFLTGVWERTINGSKDGVQLQFTDGVGQEDGSFLIHGEYDRGTTPDEDNSTFTVHLSIITPPSVMLPSVAVSMFQSRGNTYAAAYNLQTNQNARGHVRGSFLDVRGFGGSFELMRKPT